MNLNAGRASAFDFGAPRIRPLGRQLSTMLKPDKTVNNGTHYGGLAYMLQSGLAGLEQRRQNDERAADIQAQDDAQSALVSGLKGEPALDAPLPEGISGPVRPELPGGFDAAAAELATLEGNPYAGRLASQLLMANAQQQAEAQREAALYDRKRADSQSDWERDQQAARDNFRFEQDNTYRAPTQRRTIQGADGFNYYPDTGERVLPNVQRVPQITAAQVANNQEVKVARAKLAQLAEAAGYGKDVDAFARDASVETNGYGQSNPLFNPLVENLYRTASNHAVGVDPDYGGFMGVNAPGADRPGTPTITLDPAVVADPSRLITGQTYTDNGQSFVWDGQLFHPVQ